MSEGKDVPADLHCIVCTPSPVPCVCVWIEEAEGKEGAKAGRWGSVGQERKVPVLLPILRPFSGRPVPTGAGGWVTLHTGAAPMNWPWSPPQSFQLRAPLADGPEFRLPRSHHPMDPTVQVARAFSCTEQPGLVQPRPHVVPACAQRVPAPSFLRSSCSAGSH